MRDHISKSCVSMFNKHEFLGKCEYVFESISDEIWFERMTTGKTRRNAKIKYEDSNPCIEDIPFIDYDYSYAEQRELAVLAGIQGKSLYLPSYTSSEPEYFYELDNSLSRGRNVVCLTRNELISQFRRYDRLRCYGRVETGRTSFRNMKFTPHYEDHTVKTDTAVYCTPYKYSVPGFYEDTDNTSSTMYGIYRTLKLQVKVNKPIYFGKPFDFKEYEFERVRLRNYCKDI